MGAVVGIYLAALLAKIVDIKPFDRLKWWHFIVIPILYLVLVKILWPVLKWIFLVIGCVLFLDVIVWIMVEDYELNTWKLVLVMWDGIIHHEVWNRLGI